MMDTYGANEMRVNIILYSSIGANVIIMVIFMEEYNVLITCVNA